ncbi:hypothetical protein MLD38_033439 [Melastoma candidum]|uniref:Uncharacterized protein n=1 Tax=Melastoma candidum TaxID=119954 RepID=A0ACB9MB37_9MYRT|nr:hypothetical protein MLD38_033439 [Melastoma candidum]
MTSRGGFVEVADLVIDRDPKAMQSDNGKLFIGGISWDTNEESLREYFSAFGEVVEVIILKDRTTGRARGFGFVVFADPSVADRVIKEKHNIDGRMVEAKKAVPRDDQNMLGRNPGIINSSPSPGHTKKIFVGGLASTVTESDFKTYFEQFGAVNDVVVMYDHNTQRPRGFGFITYDSEEAVDKVLLNTFHELNGKMVEVKRAVPKEMSPGPTRSPLGGYNYGIGRVNSFLSGYTQGYTPSAVGGYGIRMDGRFSPVVGSRSGFPAFSLNFDRGLSSSYGGTTNFTRNIDYAHGLRPHYMGNSNRFNSTVGYDGGNGGSSSFFSSLTRNLLGNGALNPTANPANSTVNTGFGSIDIGGNNFGNNAVNWTSAPIKSQGGGAGNSIASDSGAFVYGGGNNSNYALANTGYGRNDSRSSGALTSAYGSSNGAYDGAITDLYGSGSVYGDSTWRQSNSERGAPGSFSYGIGTGAADVPVKSSPGYVGDYNVNKRVN